MGCENMLVSLLAKMRMKPKSVKDMMHPVTVCGWIVGMGVIEIPRGNPWPVASFLYTLIVVAGYGTLVEMTIENINVVVGNKSSPTSTFIYKALFYGNVWLNLCGIILGWLRVKGMKKIVRRLEASDGRMEKMGIPRDYRVIYIRQLIMLIMQIIIIIVFTFTSLKWNDTSGAPLGYRLAGSIAAYYPVIITSVADLSYVTVVRFVGTRFRQLNKYLRAMLTTTKNSPQHKRVLEYTRLKTFNAEHIYENRTRDDPNAMRAAREYHHELVHISNMINDTFGHQVLLSMTVSFVLITLLLYDICGNILWASPTNDKVNEELINAFCWLGFFIHRIILINASCDITSSVAKETGNIICQLHEPSTRKTFRDEILDFTLQLSQHSLSFTACGFFTLNYGFIQGMIGSITTYLVILIQIGDIPASMTKANSTSIDNGTSAWANAKELLTEESS